MCQYVCDKIYGLHEKLISIPLQLRPPSQLQPRSPDNLIAFCFIIVLLNTYNSQTNICCVVDTLALFYLLSVLFNLCQLYNLNYLITISSQKKWFHLFSRSALYICFVYMLCVFYEGLGEDWLCQLSNPH